MKVCYSSPGKESRGRELPKQNLTHVVAVSTLRLPKLVLCFPLGIMRRALLGIPAASLPPTRTAETQPLKRVCTRCVG